MEREPCSWRASEVPGGILATELGSDGSGGDALILPGGGSAMPTSLETVSSGSTTSRWMAKSCSALPPRDGRQRHAHVLERAGYTPADVDLSCRTRPTCASFRTAFSTSSRSPKKRSSSTCRSTATPARPASRIALCEAIKAGRLKPGYKVVFVGFGAGLTWAACAIDWRTPVRASCDTGWWRTRAARPPTAPPPPAACGSKAVALGL